MAGIYIHVPFCKKRCVYCDFFSGTDMVYRKDYIQSLIREIELRKEYLNGEVVETIYLGGGTPSQLSAMEIERVFNAIYKHFNITENPEITFEANPDDLSVSYVRGLTSLPVNRLSMGIQSFSDDDLRFLNRRHTAEQAFLAIELCKQYGYENLSIDLMYGLPGQTQTSWEENIRQALKLNIPHISSYHIIYEEGTVLQKLVQDDKVYPVTEEDSLAMFNLLIDQLTGNGYEHYEISNFARPGYISHHNSSYWKNIPYIGLGPSAHSFNRDTRQWNISSLEKYINGIKQGKPHIEKEKLDNNTRYNEFVMTGLRTMWGINLSSLNQLFGPATYNYCLKQASKYLSEGSLIQENNTLKLTKKGIFISDSIMSDLLIV